MAVFLLKALLGSCYVPPPAVGLFTDVPVGRPVRALDRGPRQPQHHERLRRRDLLPRRPRPAQADGRVPPEDAARLGLRAAGLDRESSTTSRADGFRPFIEDLYNRGITGGCAGGPPPAPISYCPANPVTRGQMAVFLTKTFGLVLYGP